MSIRLVGFIFALTLVIILILQNTQVIEFNILFWTVSMSQIIFLLIVAFLFFILGYFTHYIFNKKQVKKTNSVTS